MIRAAREDDAASVAKLIISAIGSELTHEYTGESELEKAAPILEQFFLQPGNRFSKEQVKVYEQDGAVAGVLLCYAGRQAASLYAPVESYMSEKLKMKVTHQIESELDEYYIDALAVDEQYQGQGIASKLLLHAALDAAHADINKLSLLVDVDNEHAKHVYARQGFNQAGQKTLRGHLYWHMVKTISAIQLVGEG